MNKIKISELPQSTSYDGLVTIGTNADNTSVKVSLAPIGKMDKIWFRDYWNTLCGVVSNYLQDKSYGGYDAATDTYTLNGLTLTEAEARRIAVIADKSIINSDTAYNFAGHLERTVLPILILGQAGVGRSMQNAFAYDNKKEVITFRQGNIDYRCVSDLRFCFAGNTALTRIEGLRLAKGAKTDYAFWHCYALETLQIYNLDSDLNLNDCEALSTDSVLFIAKQSNTTTTRTITLHADVFGSLSPLQISEVQNKGISLAVAAE